MNILHGMFDRYIDEIESYLVLGYALICLIVCVLLVLRIIRILRDDQPPPDFDR